MARKDRKAGLKNRMDHQRETRNDDGGFGRRPILDTSDCGDVNWFKMEKGSNAIDIIPYVISSKNHPQLGQKFGGFLLEIGDTDFKLDIHIHRRIGINNDDILCLLKTYGRPCPICEEKERLLASGLDYKSEEVKATNSSRRSIYNVIDLDDEDKGIQIFEVAHWTFEKEVMDEAEARKDKEDFTTFADLENGATITFRGGDATYEKNKFIEPKNFGFEARDPMDESILDEVYPLDAMLIISTYGEVELLFLGMAEEVETEETPPKEESPVPARKSRKKAETKEKEEPKTEAPKGRRRSAKKKPNPGQRQKKVGKSLPGRESGLLNPNPKY